jgi:uncharacterized membrane protein
MNPESGTSFILKCGSVTGVIVIAAGLLINLIVPEIGDTVMIAGITVIILTPFAGMIVSFTALTANRERKYAITAFVLILITIAGMLIGYCLG